VNATVRKLRCQADFVLNRSVPVLIIGIALISALIAAAAAFAASDHTAMWFVGHPDEMKAMILACRNDPGRAKTTPDCENAFQAEVIQSASEDAARVHLGTPPSDPLYWRYHPDELPLELSICKHLPPQDRHMHWCDSAEEAVAR
jgi:hypothetical protein